MRLPSIIDALGYVESKLAQWNYLSAGRKVVHKFVHDHCQAIILWLEGSSTGLYQSKVDQACARAQFIQRFVGDTFLGPDNCLRVCPRCLVCHIGDHVRWHAMPRELSCLADDPEQSMPFLLSDHCNWPCHTLDDGRKSSSRAGWANIQLIPGSHISLPPSTWTI